MKASLYFAISSARTLFAVARADARDSDSATSGGLSISAAISAANFLLILPSKRAIMAFVIIAPRWRRLGILPPASRSMLVLARSKALGALLAPFVAKTSKR